MAIPAGLTRLTLSGALPGGEHWASSFWQSGRAIGDVNDTAAAAIVGAAAFTNLLGALKPIWAPTTTLTDLDMYYYDGGTAAVAHGHASVSGGAGTSSVASPNQIALVTTLRTAVATRRGRGRMYWPGTGLSTNNGLFNGTAVNAVVDNLASWFNVFSTAAFPVVVLSQTGSSTAVVTAVDADLVPDTMRRRRNKLTSTRHSATV